MVNRRVWTFLTLLACVAGGASAQEPLQLDQAAPGDLLLYNAGSGAWLTARYTGVPGAPFVHGSGRWAPGLVVLTARLDADPYSDAILYDPATGEVAAAYGSPGGFRLEAGRLAPARILYRADLDRDGRDELLAYDRESGDTLVAMNLGGSGFAATAIRLPPHREIIPADFVGDGRTELFTHDPVTGDVSLLAVGEDGVTVVLFESRWTDGWTVLPARLNADERADLFLYHQETGAWGHCLMGADGVAAVRTGQLAATRTPLLGDFDGDGLDDLLLYDYFEGRWGLYGTTTDGIVERSSGVWAADAHLVVTDADADGRSDVLLYDRRDGRFGVAAARGDSLAPVAAGSWDGGWLVASRTGDRLNASAWLLAIQGPDGGAPPGVTLPAPVTVLSTPRILAFGDSLTAGTHSALVAAGGEPLHAGYPARLATLLASRYPRQTIRMTGSGVPGEWALEGKDRLGTVLDSVRPDLVLLLEGVNDINAGRTPAQIGADLQTMVNRALVRGVRVLLARLTPVTSVFDPAGTTRSAIQSLNARIDAIANQSGLGTAVDLFGALSGTGMIGDDGVHPTDAGYEQMAQTFFARITQRFQFTARPVGQ